MDNQKIVLQMVASDSRVGVKYEIRVGKDHRVYCTCPAWKYSGKNCKHLHRYFSANAVVKAAVQG